jgi:excisionase family DNA binding protein
MAEAKYLTIEETSRFLKISRSTLNRLIRQNMIPSCKIGDRRLFHKDELVEWVRSQRHDGQGSYESLIIDSLLELLGHIEYCRES